MSVDMKTWVAVVDCPCKTRWRKEIVVEWCEGCKGRGEYAVRLRDDSNVDHTEGK